MKIVIVKYNAGNIQSVLYALERIGVAAIVTDDHDEIRSADKVIFPGVGEASTAMQYLKQRNLDSLIKSLTQPVFGICLGMQLMCAHSEENDTPCLGIFEEQVKRFNTNGQMEGSNNRSTPEQEGKAVLKIPQIGWNTISHLSTDLFRQVSEEAYIYLVHSYYAALGEHTIARTNYIRSYSAALRKSNFYGVQFHPEKSAATGEQILKNFLNF